MSSPLFTPTRHGFTLPPPTLSLMDVIGKLPPEDQRDALAAFSAGDIAEIQNDWKFIARREQMPPVGDWDVWLICAGRGFGKMVSLETNIPTPSGYTPIGLLNIGDTIFDENGDQCKITAMMDDTPKKSYRVHFSDSTSIDACSEHQWVTWTQVDRKSHLRRLGTDKKRFPKNWADDPNKIKTTQEIFETQKFGKRQDRNHCIPVTQALELPDRDLLIDPYLLGIWLGDGHSAEATITTMDPEIKEAFELHGWILKATKVQNSGKATSYGIQAKEAGSIRNDLGRFEPTGYSFFTRLKALGLYKNKHIPHDYLWGSKGQRLAILQGLMDSDGYCSPKNGHVEFTSTKRELADGVVLLARSLGQKPVLTEGRATLYGKDCGAKFRVTWKATIPVVRLSRKLDCLSFNGAQALRNQHRMITEVEELKIPAPMRCLAVDSPNSMYLCGEAMIPTHNTRVGAEYIIERHKQGMEFPSAIIVPTTNDIMKLIVLGDSGIMNNCPPDFMPEYKKQDKYLLWPNGSITNLFSAEEPERLRGPQHQLVWCEELVAWSQHSDPDQADERLEYIWAMMEFGNRLGDHPEVIITTTPKPRALIKQLIACSEGEEDDYNVAVSTGSTFDNTANLSPKFIERMKKKYAGTRLGAQELYAKILGDIEGGLWNQRLIDQNRVKFRPFLKRIVIAVDPATTAKKNSDKTGIVAVGLGEDDRAYVLGDHSLKGSPDTWATKVDMLYRMYGADKIVAETNQGGDMVETNLRTKNKFLPIKLIHASKGKYVRAEPVAALYEQGRVKHVGEHVDLENQLCIMEIGRMKKSPDSGDALVYAVTELMLGKRGRIRAIGKRKKRD